MSVDNQDLKYKPLTPTLQLRDRHNCCCIGCNGPILVDMPYFGWYNTIYRSSKRELYLCLACVANMNNQIEETGYD